jgi:hypothetical protein
VESNLLWSLEATGKFRWQVKSLRYGSDENINWLSRRAN